MNTRCHSRSSSVLAAAAATATDSVPASVLCVALCSMLLLLLLLQVPTTEDEKEDFGDYDREGGGNLARKYIDDTRRRKGLWVEEKLVEKADKQRNRSVRK